MGRRRVPAHHEKVRALADPAVRERLRTGAASPANPVPHVADWPAKELIEVADPAPAQLWEARAAVWRSGRAVCGSTASSRWRRPSPC